MQCSKMPNSNARGEERLSPPSYNINEVDLEICDVRDKNGGHSRIRAQTEVMSQNSQRTRLKWGHLG